MSSAPHPLLASYLQQLAAHPLRTKSLTVGSLCLIQEILGSNLAGLPPPKRPANAPFLFHLLSRAHVDQRAVKMFCYGACISAPLSHYLVGALQRAFAGKTSARAKVGQIVANNVLVAPVQTVAFLASMAIISGAKSVDEIVKTVKAGFLSVIRIQWVTSPVALFVAQKFVPVELWVPFFNGLSFLLGTYFNYRVKSLRLAAAKKEREEKKD
ncbi:Peroxisomal membrane protein PMP22 [Mycena kentingensis (nom. inval.)]|nr:Peroxisomal membrane protein PMP22 [Mycena kentingensis (nom. inval.)]